MPATTLNVVELAAAQRSIIEAIGAVADERHGPANGRQRYVSMLDVRARAARYGLTADQFTDAIKGLLATYCVWGHFAPGTAEWDQAAVLHLGTSRHLISVDAPSLNIVSVPVPVPV